MKTLEVNILDSYKLYLKETTYRLQGNLIVLSGINGSGKSQLLRIIAKSGKEPIQRTVKQFQNGAMAHRFFWRTFCYYPSGITLIWVQILERFLLI